MWKTLHNNALQGVDLEVQHVVFMEIMEAHKTVCNCFTHAVGVYNNLLCYEPFGAPSISSLKDAVFFMRMLHNEVNMRLDKPVFCYEY